MPVEPHPESNALTLLEWAALSNEPLPTAVAMSLYDMGSVLAEIPLITKKSMLVTGARFTGKTMPRTDARKINDTPIGTKAIPEKYRESAFILSNSVTADRFIEEDQNSIGGSYMAFQVQAYLESAKLETNDRFINNKHDGKLDNDDWMVGIRARIDESATGGANYGVQRGMKVNAGGVDISPAGVTKASANQFLILLDRLLANMGSKDGTGIILWMDEYAYSYGAGAIRTLGAAAGWSDTRDNYDRPLEKYRNAKIMDIGRKKDQMTPIISPWENADGTDGTPGDAVNSIYTSIYATRTGTDYLSGWQWEELKPKNFGLVTPPGTYYLTVFDWAMGLRMQNSRSISRLYNLKIGGVPVP